MSDQRPSLRHGPSRRANRQKVIIVGSGPTGLTAAVFLARSGFRVEVLEADSLFGGHLRYGYGDFRLPPSCLERVLGRIRQEGVDLRADCLFGRTLELENLFDDHDASAVLLTVGSGPATALGIPAEGSAGVLGLTEASRLLASAVRHKGAEDFLGQNVVVLGHSQRAVACARMAQRFGRDVTMVISGSESEISAGAQDVREAAEEGVRFKTLLSPSKVLVDAFGCVRGLVCRELDYRFGGKGQLNVVPDPDSEHEIVAQTIIVASTCSPRTDFLKSIADLKLDAGGAIRVQGISSRTSVLKVFAAGHCVVPYLGFLECMVQGKQAAEDIRCILEG